MTKIDTYRFDHDPHVRGFKPLASAFARVIAGKITRDRFMVKWYKTPLEARQEFRNCLKTFHKVTEYLFEDCNKEKK